MTELADIIDRRLASEAAENERAVMGGNMPPEPTPYDVALKSVTDIVEEAELWLDGAEVLDQPQADGLALILDTTRKAKALADDTRKIEAEPFDKGKAEVQARYKPLIDRCDEVAKAVKAALTAWKVKQDKIIADRKAEAARIAAEAAEEARKARAAVDASNLAEVRRVAALEKESEDAQKALKTANRETTTAKGATSARAVSYITVWTGVIEDRRAVLNHYAKVDPEALTRWLQSMVDADARGGVTSAAGVNFTSQQVAR